MKLKPRHGIAALLFFVACSASSEAPESSTVETRRAALSGAAAPAAQPEPPTFAQSGDPNQTVPSAPIVLKGDINDDARIIPSAMPATARRDTKPARSGPFRALVLPEAAREHARGRYAAYEAELRRLGPSLAGLPEQARREEIAKIKRRVVLER